MPYSKERRCMHMPVSREGQLVWDTGSTCYVHTNSTQCKESDVRSCDEVFTGFVEGIVTVPGIRYCGQKYCGKGIVDNRTDKGIVGNCRNKDICGKHYSEVNSPALKSIGFNQVTFANGGNHAESTLTHYFCRTNIASHAELPPRIGHEAPR